MKKEHWFLGGLLLAALVLNLLLTRPATAKPPEESSRYDLIVKDQVITPKQAKPYTIITHFIWVDKKTGSAKVYEWDQQKLRFDRWKRPVPDAKQ